MSNKFNTAGFHKNLETQVFNLKVKQVPPHLYFKLLLREQDVANFLGTYEIDADILMDGVDKELTRKIQTAKNISNSILQRIEGLPIVIKMQMN